MCGRISSVTELESEEFHMKDRNTVPMKGGWHMVV